jgi:hypothetical protein
MPHLTSLTVCGTRAIPNAIWRTPHSPHGSPLDFDEDLSSLGLGGFDYIRLAHLSGAITNEAALLRKAFECVLRIFWKRVSPCRY